MTTRLRLAGAVCALLSVAGAARAAGDPSLGAIDTVVVIYAENRSFDNLYGTFPGVNGLANADDATQRDRDGSVMPRLPPIWGGLTAKSVTPAIGEAQTRDLPNRPFAIDAADGFHTPVGVATRDLWHRFYQNQMQIDGGQNDRFAAWADAGALVMGYYSTPLPMWDVAKRYTLADNFFMGAFGGSFLNHVWLACACAPFWPDADKDPAKPRIAVVDEDGVSLTVVPNAPKSALDGPPRFVSDGDLTPDFYAVNTIQPPYQPSQNKPAPGGDPALADRSKGTTLPPQSQKTLGDLLSAKEVSWAWYSGAWQVAVAGDRSDPVPHFVTHHQPYNYFEAYAPGTAARAEHLRDGGLGGVAFLADVDAGKLPQVTFYKPQGNLNEHAGNTDVLSGDEHILDVVTHLERSPQWPHMLVIVTYDENGGFWDHAAPPKGDRWGPGTRVPTMIISPYAKRGFVDHTAYDTTSILQFVTERFDLPVLPGLAARKAALLDHGGPGLGDLSHALDLPAR